MGKRKRGQPEWIKETRALKADHRWQCKPGYKVFVAGRGAVRFDVPADWVFEPQEKSFRFTDRHPPNDDCRLEVSFNPLPPNDWSQFPLAETLQQILQEDERDVTDVGSVITVKRQTAKIVWAELQFIDHQVDPRAACSRTCIGLGANVQCLITFDYWADQADQVIPVWDEVLNSLVLGLYISDPQTGLAFPD